jgi:hypothetical protein
MPVEDLITAETVKDPEYTHKSFELVFSNFCSQYAQRISDFTGNLGEQNDQGFMGLPAQASWRQMGQRLNDIGKAMGQPPSWDDEPAINTRDAILFSARYLAWNATMGGVTQQYVDKIKDNIKHGKHAKAQNGGSRDNLNRLYYEQKTGLSILLAQNHALRDYFDSGLARQLGNDSPAEMNRLLSNVLYLDSQQREALVRGISLEIASKRCLEDMVKTGQLDEITVAYGNDEEDSRGGDLVLLTGEETFFIDLKSSMPKKFSNGEESTSNDYEKGYKWLSNADKEHKVVVWAYEDNPVSIEEFKLDDERLAQNLQLVAASTKV